MKSGRIRSHTKMSREGWCSVEECGRKILARGFCSGHYGQVEKHGSVQTKIIRDWGNVDRDSDGNKLCYKCDISMPESNFPTSPKMKDGFSRYCKLCTVISHHGITREMFDEMIISQSGLCKICLAQLIKPSIDHNHQCCEGTYSCGYCIRGLICRKCNSAIGLAGDSSETLIRMAEYIDGKLK